MAIQIEKEKIEQMTDQQRADIYSYCKNISKESIEELTDGLMRIILDSEKDALKNSLGQVIFHLQKNERINTLIGLQKLTEAALMVAPDELFKILESSDADAKELAQNIKKVLG
ncbi:MAG: hypothetical protein ACTSR8_08655 [Promethearchaeota archaeon]